jgi:hypothetical protein
MRLTSQPIRLHRHGRKSRYNPPAGRANFAQSLKFSLEAANDTLISMLDIQVIDDPAVGLA